MIKRCSEGTLYRVYHYKLLQKRYLMLAAYMHEGDEAKA